MKSFKGLMVVLALVLSGCVSHEAMAVRYRLAAEIEQRARTRAADVRADDSRVFQADASARFAELERRYLEELHAEDTTTTEAAALTREYLLGIETLKEFLDGEAARIAKRSDDIAWCGEAAQVLNELADNEVRAAAGEALLDEELRSELVEALRLLAENAAAAAEGAVPRMKTRE